jgi:paraquat-inducible protein B
MNSTPVPKVTRARSFPLIWVVPLLAAAIGVWMGARELYERGPEITIDFTDASGVEAGKTILEYKGVAAGTVESVQLKPGLKDVRISLRLRRTAAALAVTDSKFWIVHPEIGFSGVHGLDTLVTGVRLNVRPGQGPAARRFRGLDQIPPPEPTDPGRNFVLHSDKLGSLSTGAPVFYREFKVGEVEASRLAPDATGVLVRIHIDAPYVDLVRTTTKFWNAGGFNFKINLFGAQLKNTSLESLVTGGVAFATPDASPLAPVAASEAEFSLEAEPEKDWLKWSPKIPIESPEEAEARPKNGLLNELMK